MEFVLTSFNMEEHGDRLEWSATLEPEQPKEHECKNCGRVVAHVYRKKIRIVCKRCKAKNDIER